MRPRRTFIVRIVNVAAVVPMVCSCVTTEPMALAPGADQIRLTKSAADVAGCKVVGNVSAVTGLGKYQSYSETQLRNRAVGLDGNAVFVTNSVNWYDGVKGALVNVPADGVAYRCQ